MGWGNKIEDLASRTAQKKEHDSARTRNVPAGGRRQAGWQRCALLFLLALILDVEIPQRAKSAWAPSELQGFSLCHGRAGLRRTARAPTGSSRRRRPQLETERGRQEKEKMKRRETRNGPNRAKGASRRDRS